MSGTNTPTVEPLDIGEAPERPLRAGDRIANRYEILRRLGSGGSAIVYAVRDLSIGDEIALKVLRPERRSEIHAERSRREAEFARGAASARLVRTFDLAESEGTFFLTMELVRGGSLRDVMKNGPLAIDEAIRLTGEVLEALVVLHSLGIVHRDVKPANLLLTEDGQVKLSDFGVARRWTEEQGRLTVTGLPLGTIDYLSPEQARGEDAGPRSDLYAVGVILFEMLTGRVPFVAASPVSAIVLRLEREAPNVRELRPDTPRWLAHFVTRLLRIVPDERYQNAQQALDDLRARRSKRSPRMPLAIAIVAMIALIALSAWLVQRRSFVPLLVHDGDWGMRATDADGRTLWVLHDTIPEHTAVVRWSRFGAPELTTILSPQRGSNGAMTALRFLDPRTGRVLRTRTLPSAASSFPDFANQFGIGQVVATDLDHDGTNEVAIRYNHNYFPCFIVVHDLHRDEGRVVFVASGHHEISGTADIDGDGVDELIVSGIANHLGWYHGTAAIRVPLRDQDRNDVAFTPDREEIPSRALLWYALTPPGAFQPGDVHIDAQHRTIELRYRTRDAVTLGFDGFVHGVAGNGALREQAYARLRAANRFAEIGRLDEAIANATSARLLAARSGDATLGEWIGRVQTAVLVRAKRFDEADAVLAELFASFGSPSDTAFDAARAFHLAGDLPRGVAWYRRAFGNPWVGRLKYETAEGLVLALGEMGKWDEALAEAERFRTAYASQTGANWYGMYVRWRTGVPVDAPDVTNEPIDLYRYWAFEMRLARGDDPQALLRAIDDDERHASETRSLLMLVRSEALRRAGRNAEALNAARGALRALLAEHDTSTYARAHLDLAVERLARLAPPAEAQAARAEGERLRWRANRMTR